MNSLASRIISGDEDQNAAGGPGGMTGRGPKNEYTAEEHRVMRDVFLRGGSTRFVANRSFAAAVLRDLRVKGAIDTRVDMRGGIEIQLKAEGLAAAIAASKSAAPAPGR